MQKLFVLCFLLLWAGTATIVFIDAGIIADNERTIAQQQQQIQAAENLLSTGMDAVDWEASFPEEYQDYISCRNGEPSKDHLAACVLGDVVRNLMDIYGEDAVQIFNDLTEVEGITRDELLNYYYQY